MLQRRLFLGLFFCAALQVSLAGAAAAGGQSPVNVPAADGSAAVARQPRSPEVVKAETAIASRDYKTAEPLLNAWLASHPTDGRALFDAAYIADVENRSEDALGLYRRCVAADPKNFPAQISLGLLLARMGKPVEARQALVAATQLDPGVEGKTATAQAWRALAEIDRNGVDGKPDYAQASADMMEALKLTPETKHDTLFAAGLAEASGQSEEAEAAYRRLLAHDPNSMAATTGLAHVLISEKKYTDAEALLRPALEKSPDDITLTAQLAAVLVAEDKADAIPLLEKVHAQQPENDEITRMLAQVDADAGEFAQSDALYVALLSKRPKDADLLTGHGQNLIRQGQFTPALPVMEQATTLDPNNGDAWSGMAFAASELNQPQLVIQALTMRAKVLPDSAPVDFLFATAYDKLRDKKSAILYYQRFLDLDAGKLKNQEWQAKQRIELLQKRR